MKLGTIIFLVILLFLTIFMVIFFNDDQVSITGDATAVASVQVGRFVSISLPNNSVSFGEINPGMVDDTLDNIPGPFVIRNDGNTQVNITIARDINSSALFNGTDGGDNSQSFQFMLGILDDGAYDITCSPSNWTNIPGIDPVLSVCRLDFPSSRDKVRIDLKIVVPLDEPAGEKRETLSFIASQA